MHLKIRCLVIERKLVAFTDMWKCIYVRYYASVHVMYSIWSLIDARLEASRLNLFSFLSFIFPFFMFLWRCFTSSRVRGARSNEIKARQKGDARKHSFVYSFNFWIINRSKDIFLNKKKINVFIRIFFNKIVYV